jgi:ABC-type nitrate/sulfonate/bicarbonate transport system substrate-binding protein
MAALSQGRVDAVTFAGPLLANALDTNPVRLLAEPMSSVIGRNNKFILSVLFSTPTYAEANPRIVQALVRGVLEGNAYVNKHHAETEAIVAEILHVDQKSIALSNRIQFAENVDPKDLQPFVDLLARYKFIEKPMPVTDLFDVRSGAR